MSNQSTSQRDRKPVAESGLERQDFQCLPRPAFNPAIRISQSMAWFRGRLFVGCGRGPLKQRGMGQRRRWLAQGAQGDLDRYGAEIWSFEPVRGTWNRVYQSPLVNQGNGGHARDRSARASCVFPGPGGTGTKPALYFAMGSLSGNVVLTRSCDGESFEDCGPPALGVPDADIASLRNLCEWQGRLYTSPVGKNRGRGMADDNVGDLPMVFVSEDPCGSAWTPVSDPGFGDPDNESVNEIAVCGGHLYAATLNRRSGFQVWKAGESPEGRPGTWTKVLDQGAWRGPDSPVPAALYSFNDALYIGTGLQRQGRGGADAFGPVAPELIRLWPDDSWDLLVGEQRFTPHGLKRPLSGYGPGFDNLFAQALWRFAAFEGSLYVGTSDWRFWPSYLPRGEHQRPDLSDRQLHRLTRETDAWRGEYGLWRSRDGVSWTPVTTEGFGDSPHQYGIREITPTPQGLFIATACANARGGGGFELWWAPGTASRSKGTA